MTLSENTTDDDEAIKTFLILQDDDEDIVDGNEATQWRKLFYAYNQILD